MELNDWGRIILECWSEIPRHFPFVRLDEFVVMPNHVHGILWIRSDAGDAGSHTPERFGKPVHGSIPTVIRTFKAAVTRFARRRKPHLGPFWQRNYHEHIIRTDSELSRIRQYIRNNPMNWEKDTQYT